MGNPFAGYSTSNFPVGPDVKQIQARKSQLLKDEQKRQKANADAEREDLKFAFQKKKHTEDLAIKQDELVIKKEQEARAVEEEARKKRASDLKYAEDSRENRTEIIYNELSYMAPGLSDSMRGKPKALNSAKIRLERRVSELTKSGDKETADIIQTMRDRLDTPEGMNLLVQDFKGMQGIARNQGIPMLGPTDFGLVELNDSTDPNKSGTITRAPLALGLGPEIKHVLSATDEDLMKQGYPYGSPGFEEALKNINGGSLKYNAPVQVTTKDGKSIGLAYPYTDPLNPDPEKRSGVEYTRIASDGGGDLLFRADTSADKMERINQKQTNRIALANHTDAQKQNMVKYVATEERVALRIGLGDEARENLNQVNYMIKLLESDESGGGILTASGDWLSRMTGTRTTDREEILRGFAQLAMDNLQNFEGAISEGEREFSVSKVAPDNWMEPGAAIAILKRHSDIYNNQVELGLAARRGAEHMEAMEQKIHVAELKKSYRGHALMPRIMERYGASSIDQAVDWLIRDATSADVTVKMFIDSMRQ